MRRRCFIAPALVGCLNGDQVRFSEGFGTPDLKEAKALLDELARW